MKTNTNNIDQRSDSTEATQREQQSQSEQTSQAETPPTRAQVIQRTLIYFLWTLAKKKKKIHFNMLLTRLKNRCREKITRDEYSQFLEMADEQSLKEHGCLLTAIVFGSDGIPGERFFFHAKLLGVIDGYPDQKKGRQKLAYLLQKRVYETAKTKFSNNN